MQNFRREFLDLCLECGVLRFGEFTLKSGRVSPYFFNAGLFDSGSALARLGRFYAQAIIESGIAFDMLFGPAYKGIPLVSTVSIALADHHGLDVPFAFDRKEAKKHAEGGLLVGAPLRGRVLIVDDVISAGTSVRAAMDLIDRFGAEGAGVAIALDRQERGEGKRSAVQEVEKEFGLEVTAISNLDHLIEYISEDPELADHLESIRDYRKRYGVRRH
jgi:orotate phosphoribosyltransferase